MEQNNGVSGPSEEAFRRQADLAKNALENADTEEAWELFLGLFSRLSARQRSTESEALLVATALDLSNLSFVMGRAFGDLIMILQEALTAADRLGDRRSRALIKLHLGRCYYFSERRHDAVAFFAGGKYEIEQLGDEDILIQSAEFLGLYFFVQGKFREATVHLERAVESFEAKESPQMINPSAPIWLGYCAAYMGEFHRAIGILDYYYRITLGHGDKSLAATIRAALGLVLLIAKRNQEAAYHLSGALREAMNAENSLALYFSKGGLGAHHCLEGRLAQAREMFQEAVSEATSAGLVRQYASPMVLEVLYEFHRSGLPDVSQMGFRREVDRILSEPNIHLRGVALRLSARDQIDQGGQLDVIMRDLEVSEDYLIRAGTPVQLAKTRIEMARVMLKRGDRKTAKQLARKAWKSLSGYGEGFFPDDMHHLLEVRDGRDLSVEFEVEFPDRFTEIIQGLVPTADLDRLLNRTVAVTNRFFGAERGGVFWFSRRKGEGDPLLRAARNLTLEEVRSEEFVTNLALVNRAYRENVPQVVAPQGSNTWPFREKAIICLPFEVQEMTRGVLYHDNSYLDGCFDHLHKAVLARIARYLSAYIGQIHEYSLRIEKQAIEKNVHFDQQYEMEIVARSPAMKRILAQADQIAASDSTVLILGETGVGKELLARRIHARSNRSAKSLVVVDPTAIPENLVESDLFGHEKGAFTGADRQKKGRMEIADGGTLFIDEVGEIPKSIQVKLLRVLQEKTLVRIGGTKALSSDFRLITATNRDLSEEVAAGRFRQDLYYRLNVIPITLPPLSERPEDISILTNHFLDRYSSKYNRPRPKLSREDEQRLQAYEWPGNVRELQNIMERAILLSTGEHFEIELPSGPRPLSANPFSGLPTLDEVQRRYIAFVLEKTSHRIGGPEGAAEVLGMKRSSLYNRMKKLGIR